MTDDRITYSAVLADLESRRSALNTRVSSIDAAIDGIKALLNDPAAASLAQPVRAGLPAGAPAHAVQARVESARVQSAAPAQSASAVQGPAPVQRTAPVQKTAAAADRRKKPGLNVYENKFPEWSRQMSRGNLNFRKKAGLRCPKCGSSDTRESITRGVSDFLMLLFDYSNARCRNCNSRFRIWKPRTPADFAQVQTVD